MKLDERTIHEMTNAFCERGLYPPAWKDEKDDAIEQIEFWDNHVRCFYRSSLRPRHLCPFAAHSKGLCKYHLTQLAKVKK